MTDYEPTAEDLAAVRRMKADRQRLIDSGAPPSTLSRGKQEFGIGMNADGTLNLVDPASPRPDRRGGGRTQPPSADTEGRGEREADPPEPTHREN